MSMRWSAEQLAEFRARSAAARPAPVVKLVPAPAPLVLPMPGEPKYRSKAEARYAAKLEADRLAGGIVSWAYEPMRLKLADGTSYTFDFLVTHRTGQLHAIEVKGHMREAARVRLRVAARLYPWLPFVIAWAKKGGVFEHEAVQP